MTKQREIKFRAWDNKKKKWLLGYNYKELGGFSLTGELVLLGEWSAVIDRFLPPFCKDGYKFDDLKIMQYTGLKDKNGKEIYEGDIVYCHNTKNTYVVERKVFEGYEGALCVGYEFETAHQENLEVIGNIYENPELLKEYD